jgi:hypothetical protein
MGALKQQLAAYGKISKVERDKSDPTLIHCGIMFRQQFYGGEFERLIKALQRDEIVELYAEAADPRDTRIEQLEKQLDSLRAECRRLGGGA